MSKYSGASSLTFIALIIITSICAAMILLTNAITSDLIAENRRQVQLKLVKEVMPLFYDNNLLMDTLNIHDAAFFGSENPITVYRARSGDEPIGLIFMPVMANGYSGIIELAIGITIDGTLMGVRVNKHKETEGFGSRLHQNNSDWILGFNNRSIRNTPKDAWAVLNDGGDFDQISGATISPRGVINAVKKTLDYYEIYKLELYRK